MAVLAGCTPPYPPTPPLPPVPFGGGTVDPPVQPPVDYPLATRTSNPGTVISPFAPYNVIDVTGFQSGQLAKDPTDPSNPRIFRIP
jgi:hypothetical protein